jgi:Trk K+ transport system NAD-binding subunit
MSPRRYSWKRYLLAHWRDVRVLLRQFYLPLLLLVVSVLLGGALFHWLYRHAQVEELTYAESVYAVFLMIFFGESVPFPHEWYLQIFFFAMPIVGLALIVQGVINFGVMLFNKSAREGEWQVAIASTYRDHVVVTGMGRLGFRTVQQLLDFGEDVVGIERNAEGEFVRRVLDLKVPVVFGDATRPDVLEQAAVERASAIITCTENDLANLEIALNARELQPQIRVVLRMFDQDLAEKVARGFDIHTAFSTSALAAPAFAGAATRSDISHAFYVGDQLLNVSSITVNARSPLVGRRLSDLEHELDFSVLLHRRGRVADLHPDPDIALEPDDNLCVFASLRVLNRLGRLNQPAS